jgi:hypothetical protein
MSLSSNLKFEKNAPHYTKTTKNDLKVLKNDVKNAFIAKNAK